MGKKSDHTSILQYLHTRISLIFLLDYFQDEFSTKPGNLHVPICLECAIQGAQHLFRAVCSHSESYSRKDLGSFPQHCVHLGEEVCQVLPLSDVGMGEMAKGKNQVIPRLARKAGSTV